MLVMTKPVLKNPREYGDDLMEFCFGNPSRALELLFEAAKTLPMPTSYMADVARYLVSAERQVR